MDQARAAFTDALNRAEQEVRASRQWETEALPNVSATALKNEIQEISANIGDVQRAFETLAERLSAEGIVNEKTEKELAMTRVTDQLDVIRIRYTDQLGANPTAKEELPLRQIEITPEQEKEIRRIWELLRLETEAIEQTRLSKIE